MSVFVRMAVDKVLPAKEMHGKTFYPVSVSDFQSDKGRPWVFNTLKPIPEDCTYVRGELYMYGKQFLIKNVVADNGTFPEDKKSKK